jgi:Uncharacterized protein family UPF0029/RWD domain
MQSCNEALNDEVAALNSIYGDETVAVASSSLHETSAVLRPPDIHFSFLLSFPSEYPDVPPQIRGTNSTGSSGRGEGENAVNTLRQVLGIVYQPGQVCLFDLLEEAGPLLLVHKHDSVEDTAQDTPERSVSSAPAPSAADSLTDDPAAGLPAPSWILSEPLTVNKSLFVARACPVSSMSEVTDAVSHLIATNKKVASATHNIKAWRLKDAATGTGVVQDHDDDGETAAGGRLLHLLQLMDAWNVLVLVTRWYGGVKLGPDRFRVINNVARDVVVKGGFAQLEEKVKGKPRGKG